MGTATTVTVVSAEGAYIGGSILPGAGISLEALARETALLPNIEFKAPKKVIGTNTVDCMKSGLVFGTAAMIDGLVDRISDSLGERPTVVATGGLSREIIEHCKTDIIYNENLLLDGLFEIYNRNK
jgi:type III pantothenate kinase